MDFRHLIVTCLFSMLRLSFETQKIKENYAIFPRKSPHKTETVHDTASETVYTLSPSPLQTKLEQQMKHFVKPI